MLKLTLAASLLCCAGLCCAGTGAFAAADPEHNVCLVTYATLGHAHNGFKDVHYVAAADLMPLASAQKLTDDYTVIFTYPNLQSTIDGCSCLANPWPANSMPERVKSLAACPRPTTDR